MQISEKISVYFNKRKIWCTLCYISRRVQGVILYTSVGQTDRQTGLLFVWCILTFQVKSGRLTSPSTPSLRSCQRTNPSPSTVKLTALPSLGTAGTRTGGLSPRLPPVQSPIGSSCPLGLSSSSTCARTRRSRWDSQAFVWVAELLLSSLWFS